LQRHEEELFSLQYQFQVLQIKIENFRYANALEQKLSILEKKVHRLRGENRILKKQNLE